MARKTIVLLEDDLTGEMLGEGSGETVTFALDGQAYEIDLSAGNSVQLRADLRRYVDASRKTSATPGSAVGRRSNAGGATPSGRRDTGAIRAWARENGQGVSERGRIPAAVVEAYDAVH